MTVRLTYEQRAQLRARRGDVMRRRYLRELRMNLYGDVRPFENRPLRPCDETNGYSSPT
jgi:hypothetical protein